MLKKAIKGFAVTVSFLASFNALALEQFADIYVFGDSLSDQGNLASVTQPFPNPPFFGDRVTNGKVALEVMAEELDLTLTPSLHLIGPEQGNNYAVAGAKALGDRPVDFPAQVNLFLLNHDAVAPEDNLYVVSLGGNDIRAARSAADRREGKAIIKSAVNAVESNIRTLIEAGAKYIMVVNSPDISQIPETTMSYSEEQIALVKRYSKIYNRGIKKLVKELEDEFDDEIEITRFNIAKAFKRVTKKAERLGFTNTTDACFFSSQGTFSEGCQFGQKFDEFLFFDEIHPTARVHAIVGERMVDFVPELEDDNDDDSDDDSDDDDNDYDG